MIPRSSNDWRVIAQRRESRMHARINEALTEPTKNELRAMLTEAVRNTAAMQTMERQDETHNRHSS
jgi:hypothetical protein